MAKANICTMAWRYFVLVLKHKWIVFKLMARCGYPWLGIKHDMSKLGPKEFWRSVKYYQDSKNPTKIEEADEEYSMAWLYHKGRNPHHWEFWVDFTDDDGIVVNPMPYRYVVEMMCDWIAAGMVYCGTEWSTGEPLRFFRENEGAIQLHDTLKKSIESFLTHLHHNGLDAFCQLVKYVRRAAENEIRNGLTNEDMEEPVNGRDDSSTAAEG